MRLTQKQEWLVARYVRAVGEELGDVPDGLRDHAISRVKTRIKRELKAFTTTPLRDPQVIGVLQRLGPPSEQAGELRQSNAEQPLLILGVTDRVWLGVCAGIADYADVEAAQVRFCALILTLLTGPLAVVAYLALYFEMYNATLHSELRERIPKIDGVQFIRTTGGTFVAVLALDITARMLLALLNAAGAQLAVQPQINLGLWEWVRLNMGGVMWAMLLTLLPIAALAGLPVAGHWQETGKRIIYAAVAIYALILCFGIATSIVGVLLQLVTRISLA